MSNSSYENFFMNFSNKTKLSIILILKEKPMNVSEIVNAVGEEQSKVSHNLIKLAECQIVDVKKKGKERIYSLNKETAIPLLKIVEKHVMKNCPKTCPKKCSLCKC
ncbi:MAG: metalloregulator ArsR/SmtB family transcription factor [Candidatus Pacearchaeota archaeon]